MASRRTGFGEGGAMKGRSIPATPLLALKPLLVIAMLSLAGALTTFRADALPPIIDLNSTPADLTVYGDDAEDWSGYSVAAGDINGDNINDLITGAPYTDPGGRDSAGETYVVYGAPTLPSGIDLNSSNADLTVFGNDTGDDSGSAVAAGDINGDGTDDLIIGAYTASSVRGETYVIYGGPSLPATIDLDTVSADLTVRGADPADGCGISVTAGDISGDGIDDLIIGASGADTAGGSDAGETYVIYGGDSLPATIDLSSESAGLTVYGDDYNDGAGSSVAAGDIDGDGIDDLIIGAVAADTSGGAYAGETYVVHGGPSLPSTIDLDATSADLTIYGDDEGDFSGRSVAAGDVNGDGTDDLIIGAGEADVSGRQTTGESYVIYGGPSLPPVIDLDTSSASLTVYGDDAGDHSGWSLAAGDLNGDGVDDLAIGAWGADPLERAGAGETYVIYGGPSLPSTIDLDSMSADLTIHGDDDGDNYGSSVALTDINGDRADDLIAGARTADANGGTRAGETYVIYGGAPSVGGIAELPDVAGAPLKARDSSGGNAGLLAGITAAAAGVIALGSAAWYARRRWLA